MLFASFRIRETRRHVGLQSFDRAGEFALHGAFGAVNVVAQNMQSRPIALCLNGHSFLQR